MRPFRLDNEPKVKPGFISPEGYFDSLPQKLMTQLPTNEARVIPLFSRKKTWYYVAAAIAAILLTIPTYHNMTTAAEEVETLALEEYLTTNTTISDDDIANLFEAEELEKIKLELNLQDEAVEAVLLNTDLEQYLID